MSESDKLAFYAQTVERGLLHWNLKPSQVMAVLLISRETYGQGKPWTHMEPRQWARELKTSAFRLRTLLGDLARCGVIDWDAVTGQVALLPDYHSWRHLSPRTGAGRVCPAGERESEIPLPLKRDRELADAGRELSEQRALQDFKGTSLKGLESFEGLASSYKGATGRAVKSKLSPGCEQSRECEPSKLRGLAAGRDGLSDFRMRMAALLGPAEGAVMRRFPAAFKDGGKWTSYYRQSPGTALAVLHELENMVKESRPFTGSAAQCAQYLWNEFSNSRSTQTTKGQLA